MSDVIPLVQLVADVGLVVLIWMVQLIIYPAFHFIEKDRFVQWHAAYARAIAILVIPLMFAQAISVLAGIVLDPAAPGIVQLVLVFAAWLSTFALSVPCHGKLRARGKDDAVITRLIRTNWPRTIAWSFVALLDFIA